MRELEGEGRTVNGNDGPVGLQLQAGVHRQYEEYANIRLAPAEPDADDADSEQPSPPSPPSPAAAADPNLPADPNYKGFNTGK